MTSNDASSTRHRLAPLSRLLVFVLLAFVTYTTTAEAVHRHNGLLSRRDDNQAAAGYSGGADSSANDSRSSGECLICQLHQHLFSGLISVPLQSIAPLTQTARAHISDVPSISRPSVPQLGRAPPLSSLL